MLSLEFKRRFIDIFDTKDVEHTLTAALNPQKLLDFWFRVEGQEDVENSLGTLLTKALCFLTEGVCLIIYC
jgi:hypothetical protein